MKKHLAIGIIGILVFVAGGYWLGSSLATDHLSKHEANNVHNDSFAMHQGHDMTVTDERSFVEAMIPHHQEAVDTAQEVIERGGVTEEVRNLAENIITSQKNEIAMMREWYEEWYQTSLPAVSYEPMMRELGGLAGADLDQVFLEDMIVHHEGAITMAESVTPYIEREEVQQLVTAILTTQTQEIELMKSLLNQ